MRHYVQCFCYSELNCIIILISHLAARKLLTRELLEAGSFVNDAPALCPWTALVCPQQSAPPRGVNPLSYRARRGRISALWSSYWPRCPAAFLNVAWAEIVRWRLGRALNDTSNECIPGITRRFWISFLEDGVKFIFRPFLFVSRVLYAIYGGPLWIFVLSQVYYSQSESQFMCQSALS